MGLFNNFDYGDKVMFGNLIQMMNQDIRQTNQLFESNPNAYERNPLVKPFYGKGNADTVQALGLLGQGYLANRWSDNNMADWQRKAEMAGLTLAEIWGLQTSGQPWKVQYGFNF